MSFCKAMLIIISILFQLIIQGLHSYNNKLQTYNYNDPACEIFVTVGTDEVNIHALSDESSFVKYQQDLNKFVRNI
ncbi:hypothetical protein BH18THE1_BH18THE1_02610 [soil metagenome]